MLWWVDVVTVKGSQDPITLYTIDLDTSRLEVSLQPKKKYHGIEKKT